ncbi:MAG: DUF6183 family protein [Actinomycetota bacterium]
MSDRVAELIEAADMNALLRVVDGFCSSKRWDDLIDLADRCEEALERGKQLWPIAAHVDYRIALEAPGAYAAEVLESPLGRFALGPFTEVAASTHSWADLAPFLEAEHTAAYVAQERVLRGEDLTAAEGTHPEVLELPLELLDLEPHYSLATYRSNLVEIADPWSPRPLSHMEPQQAPELQEPDIEHALLELVTPWTAESNGAARAAVVEGPVGAAISRIAWNELRVVQIDPPEAMKLMAWAAASGGAHGRRRGAAFGRSLAWHTSAILSDLAWPVEPGDLSVEMQRLNWFRWDEAATEEGWNLRLAVEDPDNGWAAAIGATDVLADELEDEH